MKAIREVKKPSLRLPRVPHQPDTPILQIEDLTVNYEGLPALENVSLKVDTGERLAVIGPNGAGKSTLFKVIAGVLPATSGEVKVAGYGPGGHICIAYLPQRSHVDWNFPVNAKDVVMMGRIGRLGLFRWPKRSDWEYVYRCLEVVNMADLAHRQINELSGGQQQRMFIARALAQEAELMLMDEPFTGLDVGSQEDILSILSGLKERAVTVLASTHDLNLAGEHFDRVLLLNRRLLGFGKPEQVFTPERLMQAYAGHLRLVQAGDTTLALGDTCCDDEGGHHHA